MELTLDNSNSKYFIRSYEPGKILINDSSFSESIIITPQQLIHPWHPSDFTNLSESDLQKLIDLKPQTVLIGTGKQWQMIKPEWLMIFYQSNIGVEIMDTKAACRTFNVLASEGRNIVAGLLLF